MGMPDPSTAGFCLRTSGRGSGPWWWRTRGGDELDQVRMQREVARAGGIAAVRAGDEPVEGNGDVVDELSQGVSSLAGIS